MNHFSIRILYAYLNSRRNSYIMICLNLVDADINKLNSPVFRSRFVFNLMFLVSPSADSRCANTTVRLHTAGQVRCCDGLPSGRVMAWTLCWHNVFIDALGGENLLTGECIRVDIKSPDSSKHLLQSPKRCAVTPCVWHSQKRLSKNIQFNYTRKPPLGC